MKSCFCNLARRRLFIGFLTLVSFYLLFVILSGQVLFNNALKCYRVEADSLPDISDLVPQPTKGKSIFFHETSCNSFLSGKIVISPRQACAVESAAQLNPNFEVYLLYSSPGIIRYEETESDNILRALLSYRNVRILHVDYGKYTKDTPVENLYKDRKVEYSSYPVSHASDVMRYLTLWKYGGIYLDLDVLVIKSLEDLPPNYSGIESNITVAAGVINFSPTGLGHHLVSMCVEELSKNFNGREWGSNGPELLTNVLKNQCGIKNVKDLMKTKCEDFTVYPQEAFYPVPWVKWRMYFEPKYIEEVNKLVKNSYVLHVWNLHSAKHKITVKEDVPYTIFAKKFCPKVFSECKEYF